MATLLRSASLRPPTPHFSNNTPLKPPKTSFCVSFRTKCHTTYFSLFSQNLSHKLSRKATIKKFVILASSGEATETETETETEEVQQPEIQDSTNGDVSVENEEEGQSNADEPVTEESPSSPVITALQFYKEASGNNDVSKIAELEAFFKSIEDEKNDLERKVASLAEDLSVERERVLRISADFDNFRKRTERERLSLVTNAKGEVIENFLPVLDNFERAKSQIKIGSEAEEKISNSYQSIYKQFVEILGSIGVVPVETVGKPFDPMLHEAIMREGSTEYDEGIVLEEYRKGFELGDRLLRPSMVKVSAGPGPEKPETSEPAVQEEAASETSDNGEGDAKDQATP